MPLPTTGSIPLVPPDTSLHTNQAYLIRFPEELWASLQEASSGGLDVTMTVEGKMILNIPNLPPIPLDPRSTGIPSEIHSYNASSSSLTPNALSDTRLNVPLTSVSTARAADKLKAQNEAFDRERKERAVKVDGASQPSKKRSLEKSAPGISSAGMGRTISSPQMSTSATASSSANGSTPMIPLKTRVMQLLALGPTTVPDIVRRVGGDEQNVMNVVRAIGRPSSSHPSSYTLLPNQYSKIKLGPGQWKYTYAEQQQVIRLARAAFDELDLPFDAEEREELDRKEVELENAGGYNSTASSSGSGSSQEKPLAISVPQNGLTLAPPSNSTSTQTPKTNESSVPSTSSSNPSNGKSKTINGGNTKKSGPQSKIARERAKFMAEKQRSSSLPNTKPIDGTASPRANLTEIKSTTIIKDKGSPKKKVEKALENGKSKGKGKEVDYSSNDESDNEQPLRGRLPNNQSINGKEKKDEVIKNGKDKERLSLIEKVKEKDKAKEIEKTRKKRNYSSSEDNDGNDDDSEEGQVEEGEIRGRSKILKITRNSSPGNSNTKSIRKGPPPELILEKSSSNDGLNGRISTPLPKFNKSNSISSNDIENDQESLRDRYEELYPAYQQLTKKLTKYHQAAENDMKIDDNLNELNKMVAKWEKWHKELEGIRRWFV
ncbi:uncharacterized protein I206_101647 [Kwoniella pini CBS 10737]|uniref:RNA polymerase II elongation factor ELL N-terminal domain-containing protein n=1 Tax=Kwoniella pini CBS 10737 TaxID=1296096 RepID=A0A1B9HW33_9TREE|nr:uncharacterized protein I206_06383 [Kwoniella pini CBS 10737]OCF47482.1 hypothetical protein I206_06383 [Kwoniella pini CBS 10737]